MSYRIEVKGRSYLLRLESFRRDAVRDPHRSYVCMQAAVDAGIAPAVHHADAAAGVVIADFVQERALSEYPGATQGLVRDLGSLVARLQAVPAFPPVSDYLSVIGYLFGRLLESNLFTPGLLDRHQKGFERIREAYPWDAAALVSSTTTPILRMSCSMASGCGSSTGRRPTATILWSMWRRLPRSMPGRGSWKRCCFDPGLAGNLTACCSPALA